MEYWCEMGLSEAIQNGVNSLSANLTKWSNTLKQIVGNIPTNCLRMFDHFRGVGA